jgi:hypothetical protein
VRAACEAHGVEYKTASWGATLKKALRRIGALAHKGGVRAVAESMT